MNSCRIYERISRCQAHGHEPHCQFKTLTKENNEERMKKNSNVRYVERRFVERENWQVIKLFTLVKNHSSVKFVGNCLVEGAIWRITILFTLERKFSNAKFVESHSPETAFWKFIGEFTLVNNLRDYEGKSPLNPLNWNAKYVGNHSHEWAFWKLIGVFTRDKTWYAQD